MEQHFSWLLNVVLAPSKLRLLNACLFAIHMAHSHGLRKIVLKGDSLSIIMKLKSKSVPNNYFGFILESILNLVSIFDFCNFPMSRKQGIRWLMPLLISNSIPWVVGHG